MIKQEVYNFIVDKGTYMLKKVFPEYFATEPLMPTDRYIEYPFILRNLPKLPCKVLDVGCSGSMFPLIINAIGYETHGIDIRNYYPEHEIFFTKGDLIVSVFEENSFDAITAISSIEHIGLKGVYGQETDIDGDIKALKEIHRILRPNGLFLMTVPFGDYLRITQNHKIYNQKRIHTLLYGFDYEFQIKESPETKDYNLALIKAIKCI